MDLGLTGRKALICASSQGLGFSCALALAMEGCAVTINGRNRARLDQAAAKIAVLSKGPITIVEADVTTRQGQDKILAACPEPDILVNNSEGPPPRDFSTLSRKEIVQAVEQNMIAPIELIQAILDKMVKNQFGRIINITSTSVYAPIAQLELSSGARAGLTSFLAGVARTVIRHNVTINNLLPGSFATARLTRLAEKTAQRLHQSVDDVLEDWRNRIPAHRFGSPPEFGHICAFLSSCHAGYITGQNVIVDGGTFPSAF